MSDWSKPAPKGYFAAAATLAALSLGMAVSGRLSAQSAETSRQAVISVPAFDYPPSPLISPEQLQAYARSLAGMGDGTIPAISDPKMIATVRGYINQQFEPSIAFVKSRYPVEIASDRIAGIEVLRVKPKTGLTTRNRRKVILNLHGGAFLVGWPSVALLDAIPVASLTGIEVITINYRMYPEAVHPAALEDLTAVYREVLKTHAPHNIGLFGGSAGGVTTLQAIPWFRERQLPLPAAIGAFAAGFQTGIGDSAIWNFKGGITRPGTRLVENLGYFGQQDRRDWAPGTSPDALAHYPPTLWMVGTRAPEMSGAATGHSQMLAKGVDSQLYIIEGGWHSSYSTAPQTPESQDAMRYIARWFAAHLGRQ